MNYNNNDYESDALESSILNQTYYSIELPSSSNNISDSSCSFHSSSIMEENIKEESPFNEKYEILGTQSLQERRKIINNINTHLRKLPKLENFEIQIYKIKRDDLNNSKDLELIEKRKENNRKNSHRNYIKTFGRKILKYIESKNQRVQDIVDSFSTNFIDFAKWIKDEDLYSKVSNKNKFKNYLINEDEDDKNKLIFKTICKEYMEKEAYFEIINMYRRKRIKKNVIEFDIESLYMDCNVAFVRCLDNPKNFDYCFKDFIPNSRKIT